MFDRVYVIANSEDQIKLVPGGEDLDLVGSEELKVLTYFKSIKPNDLINNMYLALYNYQVSSYQLKSSDKWLACDLSIIQEVVSKLHQDKIIDDPYNIYVPELTEPTTILESIPEPTQMDEQMLDDYCSLYQIKLNLSRADKEQALNLIKTDQELPEEYLDKDFNLLKLIIWAILVGLLIIIVLIIAIWSTGSWSDRA